MFTEGQIRSSSHGTYATSLKSFRNPPTQFPLVYDLYTDGLYLCHSASRNYSSTIVTALIKNVSKYFNRQLKSKLKLCAMEIHAYLLVLSCFLASCYSGLIPERPSLHPRQDFCEADFVIRAGVVSGPETEGYYNVFKINITEVFRGVSRLRALEANLTTKLYTPGEMSSEGVTGPYGIKAGVEYLLCGEILKGVGMYTRFTSVRKDWDDVAPQDREKLQYYETGCEERNRFTGVKA